MLADAIYHIATTAMEPEQSCKATVFDWLCQHCLEGASSFSDWRCSRVQDIEQTTPLCSQVLQTLVGMAQGAADPRCDHQVCPLLFCRDDLHETPCLGSDVLSLRFSRVWIIRVNIVNCSRLPVRESLLRALAQHIVEVAPTHGARHGRRAGPPPVCCRCSNRAI